MKQLIYHYLQQPRSYLFLTILFFLPILGVGYQWFLSLQKFNDLESKILEINKQSQTLLNLKKNEQLLTERLNQADAHYVKKTLEPLVFLLPEVKKLELISKQDSQDIDAKNRLHFLKEENRFHFIEQSSKSNKRFKESILKQKIPIEVNEEDLKLILKLIEPLSDDSQIAHVPPLWVQQFDLHRKKINLHEEVYQINFQLIKREKP